MHVIKIEFGTPEYDEAVRLRYDILRKPLGLEFTAEQLAKEYEDIHLAVYDNHFRLMGCLVLSMTDETSMKMRQVAVAEAYQRTGVGKKMALQAEAIAAEAGCTMIYCHARDVAVPFYENLGYIKEGKAFQEVGITHFKMKKKINQKK